MLPHMLPHMLPTCPSPLGPRLSHRVDLLRCTRTGSCRTSAGCASASLPSQSRADPSRKAPRLVASCEASLMGPIKPWRTLSRSHFHGHLATGFLPRGPWQGSCRTGPLLGDLVERVLRTSGHRILATGILVSGSLYWGPRHGELVPCHFATRLATGASSQGSCIRDVAAGPLHKFCSRGHPARRDLAAGVLVAEFPCLTASCLRISGSSHLDTETSPGASHRLLLRRDLAIGLCPTASSRGDLATGA